MQWQLLLPTGPTVCFSSAATPLQLCLIRTWSKFVIAWSQLRISKCNLTSTQSHIYCLQLLTFWCLQIRCGKLEPCRVYVIDCKAGKRQKWRCIFAGMVTSVASANSQSISQATSTTSTAVAQAFAAVSLVPLIQD